jgi:hypothetical protein
MRRLTALRRVSALAAVVTLGGWAGPAVAQAQISEAWTRGSTVDVDVRAFSARTEAMGGLNASVEDPQSRINPYGFSDNPAGLLSDRDSSSIEESSRYDSFHDTYFGAPHSVLQRRSGLTMALRHEQDWVLGIEGIFGGVNASRHDVSPSPDNARFIRDFDILYPSSFDPALHDYHIGASVTAPHVGITYGRKFKKKVTVAGRFRYRHESESRNVPNPYELNLSSTQLALTGGALFAPHLGPAQLTVSGSGTWMKSHVRGESSGPFNDDHYDWDRPQVGYNAQLGVRYKSWLLGIVDGRHGSYDGEEIAEVNWASQYFLNPLPTNPNNPSLGVFKAKWSALLSGFRRNEVGTRWMADLPGTPAHLGMEWHYYRELEWIRPNPSVLPSALPLDVRRLGYTAQTGVSVDLPDGKGLLGTEIELNHEGRIDYTRALPDIMVSEMNYHFGAEYRVLSWLPVRAGFVMIRRDPDRRDSQPPLKGSRITGGVGYFWDFLGTQIDASYSHEHVRSAPGDPSLELSRGDQAVVVLRYLF